MENVIFKKEENGVIYLESNFRIDDLDVALDLCVEYKLKVDNYIYVSFEDEIFCIKREEDGIVLDVLDQDKEFKAEYGYLMISAGDFEEYL